MAKQKDQNVGGETYESVARAERRLLRDEERALRRLEKARARLVRAEERLSGAKDRVERRLAAVSVAENELAAAQQARAEGPVGREKETAKEPENNERENVDSEQAAASAGQSKDAEASMPPPQGDTES